MSSVSNASTATTTSTSDPALLPTSVSSGSALPPAHGVGSGSTLTVDEVVTAIRTVVRAEVQSAVEARLPATSSGPSVGSELPSISSSMTGLSLFYFILFIFCLIRFNVI